MTQIQLIGCTGAGKSTLAKAVIRACREQGVDVVTGEELVLDRARLGWINTRPVRILAIDFLSMLACLATWRRNREFCLFALRTVFNLPRTVVWREKLNIARNVLKKVGIFEIIERRSSVGQIVLVDEGTLHAAHNLFVHVGAEVDGSELSTFARLVPLPHVVVYVRQSKPVLLARTMRRGHKRIPNNSTAQAAIFIDRAVETFDSFVRQLVLEKRLSPVDDQQNLILVHDNVPDSVVDVALQAINANGRAATKAAKRESSPAVVPVELASTK